jgi:antitoxin component YwqK of YwqJK toxin-antitoxin module
MTYYMSGGIASEYSAINGTMDGISTQYSYDGEIEQQLEWQKGKIVRVIVGFVIPPEEE